MKTHILFRQISLTGLLAFTLLLPKTGSLAQEQATSDAAQGRSEPGEAVPSEKFDLEVAGGQLTEDPVKPLRSRATVANLIEFLRKKEPEVNFILPPGAGEVSLNDVKLHAVDVMTVLSVLAEITEQQIRIKSITGQGPRGGGRGGRAGGNGTFGGADAGFGSGNHCGSLHANAGQPSQA